MTDRLGTVTVVLRIAIGLMATLAGIDKFFNLLADWPSYIAPVAAQLLPVSPGVAMGVVGVVEIAVGMLILIVHPKLGAYVASAWLTLVALNLVLGGHLDVAVRDLVLAVAAFTLATLVDAKATHPVLSTRLSSVSA
jgi:uncharacterized membrane protein YphA (DoxX/SURF4 family)